MNFYFRKISFPISLVVLLTAMQLPGCRGNDKLSPCDGSTLEVDVYKGPANTGGLQLTWYIVPREDVSFHDPAIAPDGAIWFTAPRSNVFGSLNPGTDEIKVFESPGPSSRPYGITASSDGTVWIAFSGTNRIASVDPSNGSVNGWELPDTRSRPLMITSSRNGTVWYTDYEKSKIGSLDISTGEFRVFSTSSENAFPRSLIVGPDRRIWYYEEATNLIVALDPAQQIADAIVFLASYQARWIFGQVIKVYGGYAL